MHGAAADLKEVACMSILAGLDYGYAKRYIRSAFLSPVSSTLASSRACQIHDRAVPGTNFCPLRTRYATNGEWTDYATGYGE